MEESCNPINETIDFLLSLLSSDEIIPEDPFFEQVGVFSKKLKDLLTIYFDSFGPRSNSTSTLFELLLSITRIFSVSLAFSNHFADSSSFRNRANVGFYSTKR